MVGLFPFLPETTQLGSVGTIVPVLIGGFVIGRGVHSAAIASEDFWGETSHREYFKDEIKKSQLNVPSDLPEETVDEFCEECEALFDGITLDWNQSPQEIDQMLDAVYQHVRSYIHVDARGRSRTFQAVYAFYRSMWFVSLLLGAVYFMYGLLKELGAVEGTVAYTSFIGTAEIPPGLIILGSTTFVLGSYRYFREAKFDYRRYFSLYLISDFLVIRNSRRTDSDETPPPSSP